MCKLSSLINCAIKNSWFAINLSGCGTQCQPPRRLDPTMERIKYSFVLYLQHGRNNVKCKPSIQNYGKQSTGKHVRLEEHSFLLLITLKDQ